MSLTKFTGNNAGACSRMWILPYSKLKKPTYNVALGLYVLNNSINEFNEVYFQPESCGYQLTEKTANTITFELEAKLPKIRPDLIKSASELTSRPFVLLLLDNNGQYILVGNSVDFILAQLTSKTGNNMADFNHVVFKIDRNLLLAPVYVRDVYYVEPSVPPQPDDGFEGFTQYSYQGIEISGFQQGLIYTFSELDTGFNLDFTGTGVNNQEGAWVPGHTYLAAMRFQVYVPPYLRSENIKVSFRYKTNLQYAEGGSISTCLDAIVIGATRYLSSVHQLIADNQYHDMVIDIASDPSKAVNLISFYLNVIGKTPLQDSYFLVENLTVWQE